MHWNWIEQSALVLYDYDLQALPLPTTKMQILQTP